MHPILSQVRSLLWFVLAWALTGTALAWVLVISKAATWIAALLFAVPASAAYGFITLSAYYICRSYPLPNRKLQNIIMNLPAFS